MSEQVKAIRGGTNDGHFHSQKSELRSEYRMKRQRFVETLPDRAGTEAEIHRKIHKVLADCPGQWGCYRALNHEPDLWPLVSQTHGAVDWAFPRVKGTAMEFWRPNAINESGVQGWTQNTWKILEPNPDVSTPIRIADLAGVLVPGLIFDRQGARLGSGAGFYDRAFAASGCLKVGVAFSSQIFNGSLPQEAHDIKVDFIVTENEVIQVKKGKK